jgi:PPM family protein phosphatase
MSNFKSYGCSFIGRRKNNEDSFVISKINSDFTLYAIADGMGGANAGEIASSLAIEVITIHLRNQLSNTRVHSDNELSEIIKDGFRKIQKAIQDNVNLNSQHSGMGTTLVLLLISKNNIVCANLGDSRLYFVNNENIIQITKDHSLLQEYIDKNGQIPDESWIRKYSSYLTKALDGGDSEPDINILTSYLTDHGKAFCFFMCSDGLFSKTGSNHESALQSIILGSKNLKDATEQMISYAYYQGSNDNITVALIEYSDLKRKSVRKNKYRFPPTDISQNGNMKKRPRLLFLIIIISFLLSIILLLLLFPSGHENSRFYKRLDSGINPSNTQVPSKGVVLPVENVSDWIPFNPDDYRLPLSDSSLLHWVPIKDHANINSYKLYIINQGSIIDSIKLKPKVNFILLGKFGNLYSGSEYQVAMIAITSDGEVIKGNTFKFKFR